MESWLGREEELSALFESAMDAVVVLDAAGGITRVNPAAEKLFRCTAEDLLGENLRDFLPPESAARFADKTAETRTIFRAGDFARDADVVNRRHVDKEAARQSHVAGNARALLAEGFLGDLDDDFLTGLQHFGN